MNRRSLGLKEEKTINKYARNYNKRVARVAHKRVVFPSEMGKPGVNKARKMVW